MSTTGEMPFVVVFPRGQLSDEDKSRMELNGVLCIEAESPRDVCQLHLRTPLLSSCISGDGFVIAALQAMASHPSETSGGSINEAGRLKHTFIKLLAKAAQDHIDLTRAAASLTPAPEGKAES